MVNTENYELLNGYPRACEALFVLLGGTEQRWKDLRKILEESDRPGNTDTAIGILFWRFRGPQNP
jgi:hypothetical protein